MIILSGSDLARVYSAALATGDKWTAERALEDFVEAVGRVAGEPAHLGDPVRLGLSGDPFYPRVEI